MHTVAAGGVEIPALGLGTWKLTGETCARIVAEALQVGWRHVDTAFIYDNEREVGEGLRHGGVPREEVFLTTKVWRDSLSHGDLQRAAEGNLRRLGVDYVDLLLIHWPNSEVPLKESVRALCEVKARGLARAIGVANFPSALVKEAVGHASEPLATNQVEYHPYLSQRRLLETLRRHGMSLTAYSPLAQGGLTDEPVLREVAARHGKTPAQVALRWLVGQPGVVAIPKTANPGRLRENLDIFDFGLSDDETARIDALARPNGRTIDPSWSPQWDRD